MRHGDLPTLSVLISTYNDRRLVSKKLAEIGRQSIFSDAEFIFIETASPEAERELIEPFADRHANCRLITTDTRESLYAAWNRGWQAATGDWVCYSNMDDAMHPRLLELLSLEIAAHRWDLASVLIGKQLEQDPDLNSWRPERLAKLELSRRPGPFSAWRRDLLGDLGGFDQRFIRGGDKDFWSRAGACRLRPGYVPKLLYLYTKGERQLSKQGMPPGDRELIAAVDYPFRWPARYRMLARAMTPVLRLRPRWLVPS